MHPEHLLKLKVLFILEEVILHEIAILTILLIIELMFIYILNHGGELEETEISVELAVPDLVHLVLEPDIRDHRDDVVLVDDVDHLALVQVLVQQDAH